MIPFGKKIRVGNFEILKLSKSLSKKEVKELRSSNDIPLDVQKHLSRGSLPYINVQTISGSWCISFVAGTTIFRLVDSCWSDKNGALTEQGNAALGQLFTMWYSDTSILGDAEYLKDKGESLKRFMVRVKATEVNDKEDNKNLDEVKSVIKVGEQLKTSLNNFKDRENGK